MWNDAEKFLDYFQMLTQM